LAALGSQLTSSHKPRPLPGRRGNHQSLNEDIVLLIISLLPVVCEAVERKKSCSNMAVGEGVCPSLDEAFILSGTAQIALAARDVSVLYT